jgi:hypothetical protein
MPEMYLKLYQNHSTLLNILPLNGSLMILSLEAIRLSYRNRLQLNKEYIKSTNKLRGLSPQARTIPTERPPLVGEVSTNFGG